MSRLNNEDQRDPLYRRKHASGIPVGPNPGQTAEHPRLETGESLINTPGGTLQNQTARRLHRMEMDRTETVETILGEYLELQYPNVGGFKLGHEKDANELYLAQAWDKNGQPVDNNTLDDLAYDLDDLVAQHGDNRQYADRHIINTGSTVLNPPIHDTTITEHMKHSGDYWVNITKNDEHIDPEAIREWAEDNAAQEFYEAVEQYGKDGNQITTKMMNGMADSKRRYLEKHYKTDDNSYPGPSVDTHQDFMQLDNTVNYDKHQRQAKQTWVVYDDGQGKRVLAELSMRHSTSIPRDYSGAKTSIFVSSFNILEEETDERGWAIRRSTPMEDGIRFAATDNIGRYSEKKLHGMFLETQKQFEENYDHPQVYSLVMRAQDKARQIARGENTDE